MGERIKPKNVIDRRWSRDSGKSIAYL